MQIQLKNQGKLHSLLIEYATEQYICVLHCIVLIFVICISAMEHELVIPKTMPSNLLKKDWSKRHCYYRKGALPFLKLVHEMDVYEDDVWLVTLPKCGTTWMQELLWLVMHDCNFDEALKEHLEVRSPFME